MHDDVRRLDERRGNAAVRDVSAHEAVTRVIDEIFHRLHAAGVRQFVERRDGPVRVRLERMADEVAADEPGSAGHKNVNHGYLQTHVDGPAR
jgi:hypothetical protein